MDKKVIHVQSDPPPPRFVGKSAPLRSGNQPPLNPVIFPCNVLPVIEPPFLGKPSLLAGAGRPSIALPQGRVVLPKAPSPPPMAAPRHGACRPPPGPPVACCPLARPERPRRHPRKGLAIEKKGEKAPTRPEMRPQSGFRGWAGDEQRKGEKCAAGPQKRPAGALVSVRLLRRPAFVRNRRRGAIQQYPAPDLLHLGLWISGEHFSQRGKKFLFEILVGILACVLLRELLPQ